MNSKKYWFFGSKLNTVLLLILIILMVIALRWMSQNKETYFPVRQEIKSEQVNSKQKSQMFKFENNKVIQSVSIINEDINSINFILKSEDKINKETSQISGVALLRIGDPEIEEDLDGNSYAAKEYVYTKDCELRLRIGIDSESLMRVNEFGCGEMHTISTPFESVSILKKEDTKR